MIAVLLAVFTIGDTFAPKAFAQERPAAAEKITYAAIPSGDYTFDTAHTRIGFSVRHLSIAWVTGRFKDFSGTLKFDDKDVTKSSVEFTAKVTSIDTEVEARDNHLRSADFFEVEKYPEMKFVSRRIEKKGKRYIVHGDLTIKDVTKRISFPFTFTGAVPDPWGGTRFGISAKTTINRKDFNVNYGTAMPFGGFDVGNEVQISLDIEAVKAAAE